METRVASPVPWVRALFAGSFAFFLGTAGHVMADGLLPGTAFLVVLFAFTIVLRPADPRPARLARCGCSGCWSAARRSSTSA